VPDTQLLSSRSHWRRSAWAALRATLALLLILAAVNPAPSRPKTIVAFGDSLTAGYGLRPPDAFPVVLRRRLSDDGYDATVVNAGVTGDTTQKGLARLAGVEALEPDLVILELGTNDMLNGLDPKLPQANLEEIILRLRARGTRILLAGMRAIPGTLGEAERRRFDALFPALAARHALPFFPYFLEGVIGDSKLTLWGGIHPNREGVQRIVDRIAPLVESALNARAGAPERSGRAL
jgi:acyl-CoA thioesterase I